MQFLKSLTIAKTLVGGLVAALALVGSASVGQFLYALPARYTNWQATHAWLAEALPGTKGSNGQPLNRSAVLDALVQQAIRQAAQQPAAPTPKPTTGQTPPAPAEKASAK